VCLTLTALNVSISGVVRQNSTPLNAGRVELYLVQNGNYTLSDTVALSTDGSYKFINVSNGDYVIKAIPEGLANALPTYYGNFESWQDAFHLTVANNQPVSSIDITIITVTPLDGSSVVSGYVGEESERKRFTSQKSVSFPVEDVNVYLQREQSSNWNTVAQTLSNEEGYFEFRNVPAGRYRVILDIPGVVHNNAQVIDINEDDTVQNIAYTITKDGINNNTVNINSFTKEERNIVVYPNPTREQLRVTVEYDESADYTIYSTTGQTIMRGTLQDETTIINVESLAKGIYYLKIADKTIKVVKE
jgi:hypothetical protein